MIVTILHQLAWCFIRRGRRLYFPKDIENDNVGLKQLIYVVKQLNFGQKFLAV
jgi:hypothetical protein